MSNLLLRLLTAVVAIPLLIAAIEWKNPLGVCLWVLFAQIAGLREWMNMTLPKEPVFDRAFGVVLGVAYASLLCLYPTGQTAVFGLWAVTISAFLFFLFRHGNIETVASRIAFLLTGIFYAGVLITPLALMKWRADGAALIYICL